jgi:quinol monooxygenase YgiN
MVDEIGGQMLALWVKVRVKPEERERFLKAIEVDALGSEHDEPGCLRFNVLRDLQATGCGFPVRSDPLLGF